jgi:hypothetical protein
MQINNLTLAEPDDDDDEFSLRNKSAVITNVGLPSARTIRGGAAPVARGRHGSHGGSGDDERTMTVPPSAMSTYSSISTNSSR